MRKSDRRNEDAAEGKLDASIDMALGKKMRAIFPAGDPRSFPEGFLELIKKIESKVGS